MTLEIAGRRVDARCIATAEQAGTTSSPDEPTRVQSVLPAPCGLWPRWCRKLLPGTIWAHSTTVAAQGIAAPVPACGVPEVTTSVIRSCAGKPGWWVATPARAARMTSPPMEWADTTTGRCWRVYLV